MFDERKKALLDDGDRLLAPLDCYVVDVVVQTSGSRPLLRYFVDTFGGGVGVGLCAKASRAIQQQLDETLQFGAEYAIEVSSPGLDRRLARPRDFRKFLGREVKIRCRDLLNGRRKWTGNIVSANGSGVTLAVADEELHFSYADIARANLVYEFASGEE